LQVQVPSAATTLEQYPKFPDASQQIALLDCIVEVGARVMFPVTLKFPVTLNLSAGEVAPMLILPELPFTYNTLLTFKDNPAPVVLATDNKYAGLAVPEPDVACIYRFDNQLYGYFQSHPIITDFWNGFFPDFLYFSYFHKA